MTVSTLARIEEIVRDELDDETISLTPQTKASDVEGWDSLAHVRIIASIEERFDFQFSLAEIEEATSVSALISIIASNQV